MKLKVEMWKCCCRPEIVTAPTIDSWKLNFRSDVDIIRTIWVKAHNDNRPYIRAKFHWAIIQLSFAIQRCALVSCREGHSKRYLNVLDQIFAFVFVFLSPWSSSLKFQKKITRLKKDGGISRIFPTSGYSPQYGYHLRKVPILRWIYRKWLQ